MHNILRWKVCFYRITIVFEKVCVTYQDMFKKHMQDCEYCNFQLLFCHQIYFYYLLELLDIFLYKKIYKIVAVKILDLVPLFHRKYLALNTSKWNDKKVTQPNIQKQKSLIIP